MLQRVMVWDFPTRVFHWSLALSFAGAYLSAESERYKDIHLACGYLMAGLIVFRLIWGLAGSRYARFSSFAFKPQAVIRYLQSLRNQPEHYVGHNPAGGVAIFMLLGLGILISVSGIGLYWEFFGEMSEDLFEELHELSANLMLLVVAVHVGGVILSSYLHKENLVASMLTGYKLADAEAAIQSGYRILGAIMLVIIVGFLTLYLSGNL